MDEVLEIANVVRDTGNTITGAVSPLRRFASRWRFIACVQAFDFLIFFLAGLWWFQGFAQQQTSSRWLLYLVVALIATAMIHCVFQCFRAYDFAVLTCGREAAIRAFCAGLVSSGPFLAPLLIQKDSSNTSVAAGCGLVATGLAGIAVIRLGIARLATVLRQAGAVGCRIYIVADSTEAATSLTSALERSPDNRVVGTCSLSSQNGSLETALEGSLSFLRINPVDVVILKLPLSQRDRLVAAARVLRSLPRTILFTPSLEGDDDIVVHPVTQTAGQPDGLGQMIVIKISDRPLAGWRWVMKDMQDRTLALAFLGIVAPVMLAITIAIKMSDPGPAFFRQKRLGYAGNTFDIIKFRTMRVAAVPPDAQALRLTIRDDPRVFPLGRILRKTSLDELPQLLNVLRGDMWIVGPRPHSPFAMAGGMVYAKAIQEYAARYRIKPGITGWAQVCGWRGPTDTLEQLKNRVEHDLYYIENWSTIFDIRILFKTVSCAFGHENAF